jgi:hypothetical protein
VRRGATGVLRAYVTQIWSGNVVSDEHGGARSILELENKPSAALSLPVPAGSIIHV